MKRNVMFKILLMIVVGLFLSLDAFAQQMTVKGIVKDTPASRLSVLTL